MARVVFSFFAPPVFLLFYFSVAKVDGCSCLSRLCFGRGGEGGGGGRGEGGRRRDERGPAGAASPARDEAHQKRKAGREVAWRGAVVAASYAPPVVAYYSRAPTSAAPGFSPPCVYEGARARGIIKSPWQPRDDKRSRERGRGTPAAG
jgi:hypothetical protein